MKIKRLFRKLFHLSEPYEEDKFFAMLLERNNLSNMNEIKRMTIWLWLTLIWFILSIPTAFVLYSIDERLIGISLLNMFIPLAILMDNGDTVI